ncbi:MAG TPA: serine/threonine-protein kinase [Ktedonobacteraceae bacterium]|nr:serine/threonine-protein kinase [Ktedonobacteraceae bacterium]
MRRCADMADCGYDNRDNDHFCRACALPLLGTALAGRYVVEALVSKGGYAAVFRGVDQHLSRRIAIKVLLPSKTTATEQDHFLREARIAAVLDHSNIAPILDYGKDGPSVFLVMPLYTAGSLRNRLATVNGPLLPAETVTNFHQLASALSYAHTRPRPVIHRDIKPENILIHQEDRRLIITDFGIARALEPGALIGKTVTVRGTVGYMAPEQTSGVVDPRSDQFGCGVVLYEMLTGYHPFDALGGPVRPPSMFNRELPTTVDTVVLRTLATRPEDRFADMQDLVQAFDQATRSSANTAFRLASQQYSPAEQRGSASSSFGNSPLPTQKANSNGDSSAHQRVVRPLNSSSAREKCLEGDQFLKQQQYSQALHAYEDALNLDPLNFHAWNGKGTALYSQGNYKRAYDAYQRATEIDAENPVVWVSAGLALNRLKRFPQSLVHFERALKIDPAYVAAWNGKAEAQLDMNMPEEAIESYEMALHHDEQSFQAWNGLGNARSILRDFAGAIEAYERALLANPRSAVAWCNKAEALIRHGHARAALDALHEATELDRSYARAWTLKAEVYELLGNPQEAQKARKRAKPWGLMN